MSLSRQKSCAACVQSKRKCDQGLPECRRCIARKTECKYSGRNAKRQQQITEAIGDQEAVSAASLVEKIPSSSQLSWSPPVSMPMPMFSPYTNDAIFTFGNHPFSMPSLTGEELFNTTILEDITAQRNPWDAGLVSSLAVMQCRVEFAAKKLAAIPKMFAEQGQTMFVHRVLFQEKSPPALQDALSVCALYSMKNSHTQTLIYCNVEQKRHQLIASTDLLRVSELDLLAALQALLIYQIIGLFDGNIRLRAQAEADESILIMWAEQLRPRINQLMPCSTNLVEVQLFPVKRTTKWQRWLVEESIRRTVITSLMLKGVYDYLKFGFDRQPDLRLSFTAQAALWNAQSEIGWHRACNEKENLEVRVMHWDEDMAKARPDDLEELGVLLMSMLWGIEAAGRWLGQDYITKHGIEGREPQLL